MQGEKWEVRTTMLGKENEYWRKKDVELQGTQKGEARGEVIWKKAYRIGKDYKSKANGDNMDRKGHK